MKRIIKDTFNLIGRIPHYRSVLMGVSIALLVVAVAVAAATQQQRPSSEKPPVTVHSTSTPSETPPPPTFDWVGDPTEPRRIILPTIHTEGFVQRVGVDQNKQVAVPDNIHMAGWFVDTALPGQNGLSIIDGHVDGRDQGGIFKDLTHLKPDDTFAIELGDGKTLTYKILQVDEVEVANAASMLFAQHPKVKSQLNLITCGGTFDDVTQTYDKRVIVMSALQS